MQTGVIEVSRQIAPANGAYEAVRQHGIVDKEARNHMAVVIHQEVRINKQQAPLRRRRERLHWEETSAISEMDMALVALRNGVVIADY